MVMLTTMFLGSTMANHLKQNGNHFGLISEAIGKDFGMALLLKVQKMKLHI
jgi:hypothetical protein